MSSVDHCYISTKATLVLFTKCACTPGELLAAALSASSQATWGDLMQITCFYLTSITRNEGILKGDCLRIIKTSWSAKSAGECLMKAQEKKGRATGSLCERLRTSGSFSEKKQIRGDTLIALPSAPRFERHRAGAERLTVKGWTQRVSAASPPTALLSRVKQLLLED